jgi:phosphoribosyl 1,2-cyclic phosphate phosphodiesterase
VIGCSCPVCQSTNPRDARYRSSLYVEGDAGERIIIDIGPEFRLQAIRAGITCLDAALITHTHADHLHGIDDVRPLTCRKELSVFSGESVLMEIKERFSYIFNESQEGGGKPKINLLPVTAAGNAVIGKIIAFPLPVKHGAIDIFGWKIHENTKNAAYITDVSFIPSETFEKIKDCSVLILGSLRITPHSTHFSFDEALSFAKEVYKASGKMHPKEVYLTHLCHNHSYKEIENYCLEWKIKNNVPEMTIMPAYDTMTVTV